VAVCLGGCLVLGFFFFFFFFFFVCECLLGVFFFVIVFFFFFWFFFFFSWVFFWLEGDVGVCFGVFFFLCWWFFFVFCGTFFFFFCANLNSPIFGFPPPVRSTRPGALSKFPVSDHRNCFFPPLPWLKYGRIKDQTFLTLPFFH